MRCGSPGPRDAWFFEDLRNLWISVKSVQRRLKVLVDRQRLGRPFTAPLPLHSACRWNHRISGCAVGKTVTSNSDDPIRNVDMCASSTVQIRRSLTYMLFAEGATYSRTPFSRAAMMQCTSL